MSNRVLHKQLASIMEVLANTAVAEICKVVDDGYAVLRLEMSQSKKENDALRRKLQVLELRLAQKVKVRENPAHPRSRSAGSLLCSEIKGTTVAGESFYSLDQQMNIPRRAREADALAGKGSVAHPFIDQCINTEEEMAETVLIKEERVEEDSDPEGEMKSDEKVPEKSFHSMNQQMNFPRRTREANALAGKGSVAYPCGDQCTDTDEGRIELVLIKEERVEEDSDPGDMNTEEKGAVEWRAGSREKRPVQEMQNKAANHTEELTEQHRTRRAVWEVSGLESVLKAEGESECVETLQHRATEHRAEALNSLDSEFVMFERPGPLGSYCTPGGAVTETEDPCCSYSAETGPPSLSFHSELQAVAGAGTGSGVTDNTSLSASYAETHSRKKLLICTFCGKAFNRPTKLEIHQRIHTGEKPFSCSLCGKRFAQSCNLNRHKIVHTGEKPFGCSQCGKRFARSCHLKMHQRVHASGRPYSYNRLSERRYLRIQPHRKQTGM